jgi:hypothetical protein
VDYHFCTISTYSHLYKVYALADSIKEQYPGFVLHVLVVDSEEKLQFENCRFLALSGIRKNNTADGIITKYIGSKDKLRWALKPVFMHWLLEQEEIDRVIYLDNDLFFFNDYRFLFDLLSTHSFILTPHYYKIDPKKGQNWLEANFRVGMFNAGFAGANKVALASLNWWAECCAYRCEKSSFRGLFDDQKYLDLIPVMEETAHIVTHKGCNLAGWNMELCPRGMVNGEVIIDSKFPVVFIHFNEITMRKILQGEDPLLIPLYNKYEMALKKYHPRLSRNELFRPERFADKVKYSVWKMANAFGN